MDIKNASLKDSSVLSKVDELIENDSYNRSIFKNLKRLSSKRKGKYFEMLVEEILTNRGYDVEKPSSTDHDRIVNSLKLEIKGSFLWDDKYVFRWQQIRLKQDYDLICFLALYPDRVELLGATKQDVRDNLEITDEYGRWIYNQHGGKKVNSGTFFIQGVPEDFTWMKPLEEVIERLSK